MSNNGLNGKVNRDLVGVVTHGERLKERVLLFNVHDGLVSLLLVHGLPLDSESEIEDCLLNVIIRGACADVGFASLSLDVIINFLGGHLKREEVCFLKRVEENRGGDERIHGDWLILLLDLVKFFSKAP